MPLKGRINIPLILRVAIGALLVWTGFQKILEPYQNFQYVLQGYEIVPAFLEEPIARYFPWVECIIGLFLIAGLWLKTALRSACLLFVTFVLLIGQAYVRGIKLDQCGCFGANFTVPPYIMMSFDVILAGVTLFLLKSFSKTYVLSLDRYLQE